MPEKKVIAVFSNRGGQWIMVEYEDHTRSKPMFWDKDDTCKFIKETTPEVRSALCWAWLCSPDTWTRV